MGVYRLSVLLRPVPILAEYTLNALQWKVYCEEEEINTDN